MWLIQLTGVYLIRIYDQPSQIFDVYNLCSGVGEYWRVAVRFLSSISASVTVLMIVLIHFTLSCVELGIQ